MARFRELLSAGLGTSKIAQVLSCAPGTGEGPSGSAGAVLATELAEDCARIDRTLDQLRRSRLLLDDMIDTAARSTGAEQGPPVYALTPAA